MTSNLGSEHILEQKENVNSLVMNELRHTFKPELINRIDEIIIFHSLSKEVIYDILNKIISDLEQRLKDKGLKIILTSSAIEMIIENSYDPNFGARPIKRYVQRNIESLIAKNIIQDKIKPNSTITIDTDNQELILKENV